ncbi:hypothetical protein BC941DRAFT_469306 [Chlamydoabsidia padenii]|nr:hypothetical protein BC941DRAFT_469306 [Chlamydoabsidia padenii]
MKMNSPQYHYSPSATLMTPSSQCNNVTRLPSLDHGPSIICTPTFKEESDVSASSGPPSAENEYENSPHYVTLPYHTSSSSPRRSSYFQYDREEDEFLNSYSYDSNAHFQPTSPLTSMMGFRSTSSSTTTHTSSSQQQHNTNNLASLLPPPPSSSSSQQPYQQQHNSNLLHHTTNHRHSSPALFYHQQNYMYASYPNNSFYPNMLGITSCGGNTNGPSDHQPPSSSSSASSSNEPSSVPIDLLDHQGNQSSYFNAASSLVNYANSITDTTAFGSTDL